LTRIESISGFMFQTPEHANPVKLTDLTCISLFSEEHDVGAWMAVLHDPQGFCRNDERGRPFTHTVYFSGLLPNINCLSEAF
jgi:hypothetical protein